MRRALDAFYIRGVSHNIPFLAALMAHPRFRAGRLTTNFIAEEFKGGFTAAHLPPTRSGGAGGGRRRRRARRATSARGIDAGQPRSVMLNREPVAVTVTGASGPASPSMSAAGASQVETDWQPGDPLFHGKVDGQVDRRAGRRRRLGLAPDP